MAQAGEIKIGPPGGETVVTALGRRYSEETKELSREARTADGTLVKDIIAYKKRFLLRYSLIDDADLQDFQDLVDLRSELSMVVQYTDSSSATYTVLIQPIDRTRVLAVAPYCWGNVSITLDEV